MDTKLYDVLMCSKNAEQHLDLLTLYLQSVLCSLPFFLCYYR